MEGDRIYRHIKFPEIIVRRLYDTVDTHGRFRGNAMFHISPERVGMDESWPEHWMEEITPVAGSRWKNKETGAEVVVKKYSCPLFDLLVEHTESEQYLLGFLTYYSWIDEEESEESGYSEGYKAGHSGLKWL